MLAKSRPADGLRLADEVLRGVRPSRTTTMALAARGRARFELGDNDLALNDLRAAVATADGTFRTRVVVALAAAVSASGDHEQAVALIQEVIDAGAVAVGGHQADTDEELTSGLALSQLGFLQMHAGDLADASASLKQSIELLDGKSEERDSLARAVLNLGYCELLLGRLDQAIASFDHAIELGRETAQDIVVAAGLQNQAYALSSVGEFPSALTQLQQARELYDTIGDARRNLSTLHDDMAETYRLAGLTNDAVAYARTALRSVEGRGNQEKEADARYRLAVCLLDNGDNERAAAEAEQARAMFSVAGRSTWATRAMLTALEAALASDQVAEDRFGDRVAEAIEQLEQRGWRTEALRLRNRVLLLSLTGGNRRLDPRFLTESIEANDQSVIAVLETLLHRAMTHLVTPGSDDTALDTAFEMLQAHRRRLNDPELRAGAGRLAEAFRFIALEEALNGREPAGLLSAEERWRSASHRLPPARPSPDPVAAETTRQLRELTRQAAESEEPDPALGHRIRELEERLRRSSHQSAPDRFTEDQPSRGRPVDSPPGVGNSPDELVRELSSRLNGDRLVEWFEHRGKLHAISVQAGTVDLREVGPVNDLRSAASRIRRDLARLLLFSDGGDLPRRWRRLNERARELGRRLIGPDADSAGFVLCPPGALVELPWALMIPDRKVALTVSFSATSWLGSHGHIGDPTVEVIIGPGLDHATGDHRGLAQSFPSMRVTDHVRRHDLDRALAEADVLHIAAHGAFRSDNPMFSSLRMEDGDFALHELAGFERVPALVALAACDAGKSLHLDRGTEHLGTAPAWLNAGVETIIAPICAVPDALTATVFERFYRSLPSNTPARALANTWNELADGEPRLAATAAAFLCFGSGGPRMGPPTSFGE